MWLDRHSLNRYLGDVMWSWKGPGKAGSGYIVCKTRKGAEERCKGRFCAWHIFPE